MPPPSDLAIATKAVERLVKEEAFYRAELAKQQERVRQLAQEIADAQDPSTLDGNAEFVLKQEVSSGPQVLAALVSLSLCSQLANLASLAHYRTAQSTKQRPSLPPSSNAQPNPSRPSKNRLPSVKQTLPMRRPTAPPPTTSSTRRVPFSGQARQPWPRRFRQERMVGRD